MFSRNRRASGRGAGDFAKPGHRGGAAEADPRRLGVGEGAVCDAHQVVAAPPSRSAETGGEKFIHQPDAGLGPQVGGQRSSPSFDNVISLARDVGSRRRQAPQLHHAAGRRIFSASGRGQCLILLRMAVGDGKTPVAGEMLAGLQPHRVERHARQSLDRILP